MRYGAATIQKKNGVVYTPAPMADWLAGEMLKHRTPQGQVRILDPAAGEGVLLAAFLSRVSRRCSCRITAVGYETDPLVAAETEKRLRMQFPDADIRIRNEDFLEAAENGEAGLYDFIIANPPYVRTQILGGRAQEIADRLSLSGRVDMYYAFLLCTRLVLAEGGIAGYITSNKFMTIKAGGSVRSFMLDNYSVLQITDLGDTRLFNASVLPCILIFTTGRTQDPSKVSFTSVYETQAEAAFETDSIYDALCSEGTCEVPDGRHYAVRQGRLNTAGKDALWIMETDSTSSWLARVDANTWRRFKDLGKVRVGIKTTADNVFIGSGLEGMELLRPLITHRNAGRIIPNDAEQWKVLYTCTTKDGRRIACNLDDYPVSKAYLAEYFGQLSSRTYIEKAGREWYEIWVPQDPDSWKDRKIVFRDISERPEFWLDTTGAVVNGDCYWIDISPDTPDDWVYLALAVANSSFMERYYDCCFNTKLYSGKRRFMTQYVEQFPLPCPDTPAAREAISLVQHILSNPHADNLQASYAQLDTCVERLFMDPYGYTTEIHTNAGCCIRV